ncbi:MAG: SGNH/GDSL hydrolase family protein [Lachnospiraceae bacterium]|nr:SGNH/GDSL hydrolase family protein [Lachnospiraceae bacterium]
MFEIDRAVGLVNEGDDTRLRNVMRRAAAGERLTVGFIGGSITQGSLASAPENCYAYRVYTWWRAAFPEADFVYLNVGIGATTSQYGAARVQTDLLIHNPDVVFVEFSVNDESNEHFLETYEGLVRQILIAGSTPAVVLIHNVCYNNGASAQLIHERVGRHYDLPCVSMQNTIYPELLSGRIQNREITPDDLHPNDAGHELVASVITCYLEQVRSRTLAEDADEEMKEAAKKVTAEKETEETAAKKTAKKIAEKDAAPEKTATGRDGMGKNAVRLAAPLSLNSYERCVRVDCRSFSGGQKNPSANASGKANTQDAKDALGTADTLDRTDAPGAANALDATDVPSKANALGTAVAPAPAAVKKTPRDSSSALIEADGFEPDLRAKLGITDNFKNGWTASAVGAHIVFELEGTGVSVQFCRSVNQPAPIAEIVVDQDPATRQILDANFDETWGDKLELLTVTEHMQRGVHRIEVRLIETHADDAVPFYLNAIIMAD